MKKYITDIALGLWRLFQGMYITMLNLIRPKFTEQYPENRGKKEYFDRFRALLTMEHDGRNFHKCTACGICQNNCPNGTITVVSKMIADEAAGREKKALDRYVYDLGSCTFCGLCTVSCPFGAIGWSNDFEHSLFTRSKLVMQLNLPGSSLAPKPAPAASAVPAVAKSAKTE
jgi:NADH-quinone oxidoreductase subunit I